MLFLAAKGAKTVMKHRSPETPQTTNIKNTNVHLSIQGEKGSIDLSISREHQKIDDLLKKEKYQILRQLRDHLIKEKIKADFYSLLQERSGLINFLNEHPLIKRLFMQQINKCIDEFFQELTQKSPV